MKISLIHPSRSRPEKSVLIFKKWMSLAESEIEFILSIDEDEPTDDNYTKASKYITLYNAAKFTHAMHYRSVTSKNKSCVDAINNAVKVAKGDILIVVSDDTDCFPGWDTALLKELEGKSDYLLKTDDGIQDYIVTMTVCDRTYFERDNHIYHPYFFHQFADTYLTCKADIRGRLIYSKLKFPHNHFSTSGGKEVADALNHRNDLTWKDGQDTFVRLMKEFTPEERNRITNKGMRAFLKRVGL